MKKLFGMPSQAVSQLALNPAKHVRREKTLVDCG
jgi:hypothetical protein